MIKKKQLLLFDLDDTLYPEIEYVKSGFRQVSVFLGNRFNLDINDIFRSMLEYLQQNGRNKIFNYILEKYKIDNNLDVWIKLMVNVYRSHKPDIKLFPNYREILKNLKKRYYLAIITNGKSVMQQNKITALNLDEIFDLIIICDNIGKNQEYWKPSIFPFKITLEYFDLTAKDAIYIGDNIEIDSVGASKIGIDFIHISDKKESKFPTIPNLYDLNKILE